MSDRHVHRMGRPEFPWEQYDCAVCVGHEAQRERIIRALEEIESWEDEAPARGEREFAKIVLASERKK